MQFATHLGDQHKLLIIPLEDVPLLPRNGFHGNSAQFYVLCIFKTHEIKLKYNNYRLIEWYDVRGTCYTMNPRYEISSCCCYGYISQQP